MNPPGCSHSGQCYCRKGPGKCWSGPGTKQLETRAKLATEIIVKIAASKLRGQTAPRTSLQWEAFHRKKRQKNGKKKRQRKTKSRMPYLAAAGEQCWGQWSCSESSCRSEQFPGPKPQWRRWQRRWRRIAFSKLFWLTNKFTRVSRRMIKR